VTIAEYFIGLSTFAFIHFLGVEYGILGGVLLYVFCRQLSIDVGELKQISTQEDQSTIVDSTMKTASGCSAENESLVSNGASTRIYDTL
jgi:hypothetical protein